MESIKRMNREARKERADLFVREEILREQLFSLRPYPTGTMLFLCG
jgi:hypothetical protein